MYKSILIFLAAASLALVCGCDGSASRVKNGILSQYPDVTVGAAFNCSFYDTKWESFTDKGREMVRFTGKIRKETHDNAMKALGIDANGNSENSIVCSRIVNNFKKDELAVRLKPYDDKVEAFESASKESIGNIYAEIHKGEIQYEELTKKKQLAANNYIDDKSPENKKILDDIKNKLELMDKECKEFYGKLAKYKEQQNQLENERNTALLKIQKELFDDFMKNSYWPVGSVVQFEFMLYPDGKKFDIDRFSNESWLKMQLDLESVMNVIYAR